MLTGKWTHEGFPSTVTLGGVRFKLAGWAKPYRDVVAQYREDTKRESRHLKVFDDGHWTIDHVDTHNPDTGNAVGHFFQDYNPLVGPLLFAGTLLVGAIAYGKRKFKFKRRGNLLPRKGLNPSLPIGFGSFAKQKSTSRSLGRTAKEERKYKAIKKGYGRDPRATEIAARTVYAQRKKKR